MRGAFPGTILFLLATSCAKPPAPGIDVPLENSPTIVGPRGALAGAQVDRMLDGIESRSAAGDILQRHVAAEEQIAGMPLSAENHVTLLEDGPSTYASMFQAINAARDHINVEFYTCPGTRSVPH